MSIEENEFTKISVQGAREHNLKNVSVEIPRDKLVVITGLSGSGKSSLAFDTIYAEGQRRYVECMSSYARQFLGVMKKPDVDIIEGLSPAISIEQKSVGSSPRSTVGTITEIYDYFRLLYAKVGVQYCVNCDIPVKQQTLDQICDALLTSPIGTKLQILAPIVKGRKGHYRELFDSCKRQGFTRVRVDGTMQEITDGMQLARYKVHNIELVVDRLVINPESTNRLRESVDTAIHRGEGGVIVLREISSDNVEELYYSTSYSCPQCGTSYEALAPTMFSFNSPSGACETCEGLGEMQDFNPDLVMPIDTLSVLQGGIAPLGKKRDTWLWKQVTAFAKAEGIDLDSPINTLSRINVKKLLYGNNDSSVEMQYAGTTIKHKYIGILPSLRHQFEQSTSAAVRKSIEKYFSVIPCRSCYGARLQEEHLFVRVNDMNIHDIASMDIEHTLAWFDTLHDNLDERQQLIGNLIIKEVRERLRFLIDVGLNYLTLTRNAKTLSGGESQRIKLASQIGSQLVGVTYVLDEPSIGLHQHDNRKLITSLKNLRDLGNTIIVVEHDKDMIQEADEVVDIGPGAGVHGGHVVAQFSAARIKDGTVHKGNFESLTLEYITGQKQIPLPAERRIGKGTSIALRGATGNNLRNVDLTIPVGKFVAVTGMSGSGKSTLVNDTLFPILSAKFYHAETRPLPYASIEGLENIDKVIEIDQSPIGRTPRSNPATYTGLFTQIRDVYTFLPEAKIRGYKAGRFSFNVSGGRCDDCEGAGIKKIEMNFLPDVYVPCDTCGGKRYNAETLSVRFKGKSIADVLDMTVEEAFALFQDVPKIRTKLAALMDVGLTYITLGQQAPTLSGGEAQRVKLATELSKSQTGKTLYLLDEPTTGLHFEDVAVLLRLLDTLANKGNTVVVIEHNLDVIIHADHVIDLGPGGGRDGGMIVAEGTPEEVAVNTRSITGKYIAEELKAYKTM